MNDLPSHSHHSSSSLDPPNGAYLRLVGHRNAVQGPVRYDGSHEDHWTPPQAPGPGGLESGLLSLPTFLLYIRS
ncbi:hypothetical protein BDBG_17320 [Blastomyces gilchristii SLH14081]|uniref:Uncharacterized protein n=1 Tax=Blastomyces gilchristii (strain SLH14081) TaxID=559298 RepID=A0A179UPZ8_BLAGS|nr:uncharacterized protein BDBG_17320 [Blastomyces gilchristii SLH14081]OAT10176.1 hypothetical protein BDBG_17320 [Blastomyces gilchristii SLH14081]